MRTQVQRRCPSRRQERINAAVFPGLQGGPHNQSITAGSPEFTNLQEVPHVQHMCIVYKADIVYTYIHMIMNIYIYVIQLIYMCVYM